MAFDENFQSGAAKICYCEVWKRELGAAFKSKDSFDADAQQALHQLKLALQRVSMQLVRTQLMNFSEMLVRLH
jgi:hypothetical protein